MGIEHLPREYRGLGLSPSPLRKLKYLPTMRSNQSATTGWGAWPHRNTQKQGLLGQSLYSHAAFKQGNLQAPSSPVPVAGDSQEQCTNHRYQLPG